ncbi:MAG: A/G-specific adenine glycosylase [Bacteroidetes bacterium]|nr:MAG: A/G-specific adenine glycosylase [Bacteroidota bacterium]
MSKKESLTEISASEKSLFFRQKLLEWFAQNHRPMPWKGEKDPYLVWLSEIILQQTRVEQGWPYFEKFRKQYPTVHALAQASEDDVLKLWEGLGYYSRARNLHYTARYISEQLDGVFPNTLAGLLKLKGVGPYTAAAIASFAFDLPHAVVDGNVFRVLSRFFGIETPIDSTEGKKEFTRLANQLLDPKRPADFNQAIMDFGAIHCTPATPNCGKCILTQQCVAFQSKKTTLFPVKSKRPEKRKRHFNYLIINEKERVFIHKRTGKDIWRHLYEFPIIETNNVINNVENLRSHLHAQWGEVPEKFEVVRKSRLFKQTLTHQIIVARFWEITCPGLPEGIRSRYLLTERKNLSKFALPKIIDLYLRDKSLILEML